MDVREKLVELLCGCPCESDCEGLVGSCPNRKNGNCNEVFKLSYCAVSKLAQHLIYNGVTVQEWISVKDRLPEIPEGWAESPEPVLYMMKNTKTIYAGYYGEGGMWRDKYFRQYADSRNGVDADDALCWMYQHDLPQPPKGE